MMNLNTFSESLAKELGDFQNSVVHNVKKVLEPEEIHNHPPVSFIVTGCPYCEKYGNCFALNKS